MLEAKQLNVKNDDKTIWNNWGNLNMEFLLDNTSASVLSVLGV